MSSVRAAATVAARELGARTPTHVWVPPYASTAGQEAVELAASVGLILDGWQQDILIGMLGEDRRGKHTAFETATICPRQNGKNAWLEARELWGLFLAGEKLQIHTSHKFDTTLEHYRRMLFWIESNDWLRKRCKKPKFSHGDEGIELLDGRRLRILARSPGSGRGFSADFVALDEAYAVSDEMIAAMMPALSARPDPQIAYTSSAGDKSATVLRSVRDRGRAGGDPSLAYFEWCAEPDDDLDDRAVWLKANPSVGWRENSIRMEFIAKERAAMTDAKFARERLGVWDDVTTGAPIAADAWDSLADPDSLLTGQPFFAVDVHPDRISGVIAAWGQGMTVHRGQTEETFAHVELVDTFTDMAELVANIRRLAQVYPASPWAIDPSSPAGALIPDLAAAGIDLRMPNRGDYARACGALVDVVDAGSFRHTGDPLLAASIAALSRRPIGESFVWSRKSALAGDIGPAIAVTLARWCAITQAPEEPEGEPHIW